MAESVHQLKYNIVTAHKKMHLYTVFTVYAQVCIHFFTHQQTQHRQQKAAQKQCFEYKNALFSIQQKMCNLHFGRLTGTTIQNQEKGHAKGLKLFSNVNKGKQVVDLRVLCS